MDVSVRHNEAEGRFEAAVDGGIAASYYVRDGDTIIFTHTEVPQLSEGKGVGNALARAALDYARSEKLRVVADCPFIASYIKRHKEYQDLL